MQTFSQVIPSAKTVEFNIPGKYFILLGTTLGVDVSFYKQGKKLDLGDIKEVLPGLEAMLGESSQMEPAFDQVKITTYGLDTIKFGIGNGLVRYSRSQGDVNITNPIISVDVIDPLLEMQMGDVIFNSVATLAGPAAEAILLPAGNTNGAILDWFSVHSVVSASANSPYGVGVFIGTAAPTGIFSQGCVQRVAKSGAASGEYIEMISTRKYYLPAGWGAWFLVGNVETSGVRSAAYKLL